MGSPFDLGGKTYLITGASSGVGSAVARFITQMGAKVVITGRNASNLQTVFDSLIGEGHSQIICDLLLETDRKTLIDSIPPIDGVVHSAGVAHYLPFKLTSKARIEELQNTNFLSPVELTQALLKANKISQGGSILFVSSIAATQGSGGLAFYSAAKAAIVGIVRVLALELAPQKIRVNAISPGMLHTPMTDKIAKSLPAGALEAHEKEYPLGFGEPEDVAHSIGYLLSDAARWMTGSNLILDGGYSCH